MAQQQANELAIATQAFSGYSAIVQNSPNGHPIYAQKFSAQFLQKVYMFFGFLLSFSCFCT